MFVGAAKWLFEDGRPGKDGDQRPLRDLIEDLIDFCGPVANDIRESQNLELAKQILAHKPGYAKQIDAYLKSGSARAVAEYLGTHLEQSIRPA